MTVSQAAKSEHPNHNPANLFVFPRSGRNTDLLFLNLPTQPAALRTDEHEHSSVVPLWLTFTLCTGFHTRGPTRMASLIARSSFMPRLAMLGPRADARSMFDNRQAFGGPAALASRLSRPNRCLATTHATLDKAVKTSTRRPNGSCQRFSGPAMVVPVGTWVRNAKGTSQDNFPNTKWRILNTQHLPADAELECSATGCCKKATLGGHVILSDSLAVVPLCHSHNHYLKHPSGYEVKPGTKSFRENLVSAEREQEIVRNTIRI